jgi:hypothetical protein
LPDRVPAHQHKPDRPRRHRLRAAALVTVAAMLAAAVAGVAYLRIALHGEGLARTVTQAINAQIRGRVEVESITWPMSAIPRALVGGFVPVKVRHVRVYDELGDLIIETGFASGELSPYPAALGRHDFILRNIVVPEGGYVLLREIATQVPKHEGDDTTLSLLSAFDPPPERGLFVGSSGTESPLVDLRDFEVHGVTFEFALPDEHRDERGRRIDPVAGAFDHGVYARAEGISGRGFFVADHRDPTRGDNYFSLEARAERGLVRLNGVQVDIEELEVDRLAQLPRSWRDSSPRDLEMRGRGRTPEGAAFDFEGALRDYLDDDFEGFLDIAGSLEHGDGLALAITGGALGGEGLHGTFRIGGRALFPILEARASGATFEVDVGEAHPPIAATVPEAIFDLELMTRVGTVKRLDVRAAEGAITAVGGFKIDDVVRFEGRAETTEDLEVRRYLPEPVIFPLGGTKLSGNLHLAGRVNFEGVIEEVLATDIDMQLGRARIGGRQRYTMDGRIHTAGLEVRIGRTTLLTRSGGVDLQRDRLDDIRLSIRSQDFDDWLRRYETLPVARTLHGTGRYFGPIDDPRFTGSLRAGEVPVLGEVDFELVHQGERAGLHNIRAEAFSGKLAAGGEFQLGLWPRILGFEAEASEIDLSALPVVGAHLSGRATASFTARGSFDTPELELQASAEDLTIGGDPFTEFQLAAALDADGARTLELELGRSRGGALAVDLAVAADGMLSGDITLDDLDLTTLATLATVDEEPFAGGRAVAHFALSGAAEAPEISGQLSLREAFFQAMHLGTADLRVEPARPGLARIRGRIFEGMAEITGTVETVAPYHADLAIAVHRVELDRLVPELAAQAGARAWVSGEARVRGPLWGGEGPEIDLILHEAVVHVDQTDVRGRPRPVRLENQTPIHIGFEHGVATITSEAVLAGRAGRFELSGSGSPNELDFRLRGALAIHLLGPYFRQQFDDLTGAARLDLRLTGPALTPRLSGTVDLEDVEVRLAGQDAILRAPAGKIEFANDQLAVTGLTIEVLDPYSDEVAELSVAGGVRLDDFQPVLWALHIHGALGGKLLLALFPEELSTARGAAELSLSLLGHGPSPSIDGEIRFATEHPIAFAPRGMRREILIDRGIVRFTDDLVELERVGGWVDDEGYVADVSGEIGLLDGQLADIDVTITADDLPFRVPQTLELLLGLREVRIVGDLQRGIEIAGDVLIVDGRYIQDFNPLLDEIRPRRVIEDTPPFWEEIPILATADLALRVETRSFFVRNNVANVELTGGLDVTGTPAQPQLDGVVRVEGGSFKFQGVRAEFQRTTGTVTFEQFRTFPETTPTLDIRSESEYRDFSGEDHLVVLTLTGPLGQLQWDLFTTAGLNKAQTFLLIVSGRTPDEARRVIGDEPVGRGPGEFAGTRSTEAPDGNLALVDQLVKDLAGDFFSLLIEDSIRNVTDLDVARLQLGTASVGFHGEKRFTRSFRVLGDLERSLRGWAWDVRGEYRLLDQLSLEGEYLQKSFDDDVEEDVKNFRIKAVWRWLIP